MSNFWTWYTVGVTIASLALLIGTPDDVPFEEGIAIILLWPIALSMMVLKGIVLLALRLFLK